MDASAAKRRWFWPTPTWLVWGAAVATGVLFACERWRWFPQHYQKGWPVLLAVAVVAAVLILILAWMLVALLFRRRVQFGLRTMLVFVTLCAVVCSWLAVRIKQARRQKEAVAFVRQNRDEQKCRVVVTYDWLIDLDQNPLSIRQRLAGLMEPGFFADVEGLLVDGEQVTDTWLLGLDGLTNLRHLHLYSTRVTHEGVKKLQRALPECEIYVNNERQ